MAVAALIPLEVYLSTSYHPDREYVEGRLLERNVGELDHSYLQFLIARILERRGLLPFPGLRAQVAADRFRVPDVLGERTMPTTRFIRKPPCIVVEILSRDDQASEVADKVADYLAFGVANIWVIDPRRRRITVHTTDGARICAGRVETTDDEISIPLEEIFGQMPFIDEE